MKEITKMFIGFIGAIVTLCLIVVLKVPWSWFYSALVIFIFWIWVMVPNKYFYVSARDLRKQPLNISKQTNNKEDYNTTQN